MAILKQINSSDKIYQKFYEKTGIRITDEPVKKLLPELDSTLERLYHLAQKNPKKALPGKNTRNAA